MLNLLNATSLLSTINHALRPLLWIGCFVHFFLCASCFLKIKQHVVSLSLSCVCLCCLVEKIIRFNWKFPRNFNVFFIRLNSNPICFFFIWRRTEWQIAHRRRVCNTYSNNLIMLVSSIPIIILDNLYYIHLQRKMLNILVPWISFLKRKRNVYILYRYMGHRLTK